MIESWTCRDDKSNERLPRVKVIPGYFMDPQPAGEPRITISWFDMPMMLTGQWTF